MEPLAKLKNIQGIEAKTA